MNRKVRARLDRLVIVSGDVLSVVLGFILAWVICYWTGLLDFYMPMDEWLLHPGLLRTQQFLIILPVLVGIFWVRGHYISRRPAADEWLDIIKSVSYAATIELLILFMMKWTFSRAWFVLTWCLVLFLIPIIRHVLKLQLVKAGHWIKRTLIVGTGKHALDTARMLESDPLFGMKIVAFMELPSALRSEIDEPFPESGTLSFDGREIPVIRYSDDPSQAILKYDIGHTIVSPESDDVLAVTRLLFDAKLNQHTLHIVPNLKGLPLTGIEVLHFFRHDLFMLQIRNNLSRKMPQRVKRAFDLAASLFLIALFSPLMLACLVIIGWSRQGAIFSHARVGQNGKPFMVHKFRTMVPDSDYRLEKLLAEDPLARQQWDRDFKIRNDPRVTRIGGFLRRTSIDELPQLWNVIKGDMSLVGPRPIEQFELETRGDNIHYYLQTKPGITGLWQISGRSDTDYATRVYMDAWYAKNWTLWYDFFILLKTIQVVIKRGGAH